MAKLPRMTEVFRLEEEDSALTGAVNDKPDSTDVQGALRNASNQVGTPKQVSGATMANALQATAKAVRKNPSQQFSVFQGGFSVPNKPADPTGNQGIQVPQKKTPFSSQTNDEDQIDLIDPLSGKIGS